MKPRPAIRIAFVSLAIVSPVVALALPTAWYAALPRNTGYPPRPFAGTILLRLAFFFEAVVLAVLAATGWKPVVEHVRSPAAMRDETVRVLRSGGAFSVTTNNKYSALPEPHVRIRNVGDVTLPWFEVGELGDRNEILRQSWETISRYAPLRFLIRNVVPQYFILGRRNA